MCGAPILLLLASACSNERGGLVFSDEERDSKDAILSKVLSVDSLNDMLLDYEEQKDELGQIVAYRYLGIRYREENQEPDNTTESHQAFASDFESALLP